MMRKIVPADRVELRRVVARSLQGPLDITIYKSMEEETLRNKDFSRWFNTSYRIALGESWPESPK